MKSVKSLQEKYNARIKKREKAKQKMKKHNVYWHAYNVLPDIVKKKRRESSSNAIFTIACLSKPSRRRDFNTGPYSVAMLDADTYKLISIFTSIREASHYLSSVCSMSAKSAYSSIWRSTDSCGEKLSGGYRWVKIMLDK